MAPGSFFSHPAFTDIYSFILHLVNTLYESIPAANPRTKDGLVAGAMAAVQRALAAGDPPSLKAPAARCAYFYSFTPSHINVVRHFLDAAVRRGGVPELVRAVGGERRLKMVALGGGAGGDVLGVLHWLAQAGCGLCGVDEMALDPPGSDWSGHHGEIGREMAKTGLASFEQTCLRCNYSSTLKFRRVVESVAAADLVTMVKGVSSAGCARGAGRENVWDLLGNMKEGAVLLVVDDTSVVQKFIGDGPEAASLQRVVRMDFNEAQAADFVTPKDEERIAFCFQAAASRFGGWPVQEAYITGMVFRRVAQALVGDVAHPNGRDGWGEIVPALQPSEERGHRSLSERQRLLALPSVVGGTPQPGGSAASGTGQLPEQIGTNGDLGLIACQRMQTSVSGGWQAVGTLDNHRSAAQQPVSNVPSASKKKKNKKKKRKLQNEGNVNVGGVTTGSGIGGAFGLAGTGHGVPHIPNGTVAQEGRSQSNVFFPAMSPAEGHQRQQQHHWQQRQGKQNKQKQQQQQRQQVANRRESQRTSQKLQLRQSQQQQACKWGTAIKPETQPVHEAQQRSTTAVVDLNAHMQADLNMLHVSGSQLTRFVDLNAQRVLDSSAQSEVGSPSTAVVDLNMQRIMGGNQPGRKDAQVVDLRNQGAAAHHNTTVVDLNQQRLLGAGALAGAHGGNASGPKLEFFQAVRRSIDVQRSMAVLPMQHGFQVAHGEAMGNGTLTGKRTVPGNLGVQQPGFKHARRF